MMTNGSQQLRLFEVVTVRKDGLIKNVMHSMQISSESMVHSRRAI